MKKYNSKSKPEPDEVFYSGFIDLIFFSQKRFCFFAVCATIYSVYFGKLNQEEG